VIKMGIFNFLKIIKGKNAKEYVESEIDPILNEIKDFINNINENDDKEDLKSIFQNAKEVFYSIQIIKQEILKQESKKMKKKYFNDKFYELLKEVKENIGAIDDISFDKKSKATKQKINDMVDNLEKEIEKNEKPGRFKGLLWRISGFAFGVVAVHPDGTQQSIKIDLPFNPKRVYVDYEVFGCSCVDCDAVVFVEKIWKGFVICYKANAQKIRFIWIATRF
jgi:hypothetical protein